MTAATTFEIQESLNILAYGSYPPPDNKPPQDAQQAANDWASTTGLDLVAALNVKAGNTMATPYQDLNAVCNQLASTTGLDAQAALSSLAGGVL